MTIQPLASCQIILQVLVSIDGCVRLGLLTAARKQSTAGGVPKHLMKSVVGDPACAGTILAFRGLRSRQNIP